MKRIALVVLTAAAVTAAGLFVPGCFLSRPAPAAPRSGPAAAASGADGSASAAAVVGDVLGQLGAAPLSAVFSDSLGPFFWGGFLFAAAGALSAILLGARKAGLSMIAMGAAMTGIGILFGQYPWVVLVAFGGTGALYLAKAADAWRTEKARKAAAEKLAATEDVLAIEAQVIETVPEGELIKKGIKELGPEVAGLVKSIVSPIKAGLAKEGRI